MLKEHNREAYEATKNMLLEHRECCLVAGTGVGKTSTAIEIVKTCGFKTLVICHRKSIINSTWNRAIKNENTDLIDTTTYQYFHLNYNKLYGYNLYIFDEAHHMGSPEWSRSIKDFKKNNSGCILGLTADANRYFEYQNIIDTIFNGHGVYGIQQDEAIEMGILPEANYVAAYFDTDGLYKSQEKKGVSSKLLGKLRYCIENTMKINDILKFYTSSYDHIKGIVFVENIKSIQLGMRLIGEVFPDIDVSYIHSKLHYNEVEETLTEFYSAKSGFMIAVDMLNEGNHIPGMNVAIMLRKTSSPTIFLQQIGRILDTDSTDRPTIFDFVGNKDSVESIVAKLDYCNYHNTSNKTKKSRMCKIVKISNQIIIHDHTTSISQILKEIKKELSGNWSIEEDQIILYNYPTMGWEVYKLLENRTKYACKRRAEVLGVSSNNRLPWSKKEDQILRDNYPTMGKGVYKLLKNRTQDACRTRAATLGLRYNDISWTTDEDQILKDNYPIIGSGAYKLLPNRSIDACRNRVKILCIKKECTNEVWTPDEDQILIDNYPTMGKRVQNILKNRTVASIMKRARRLNIKYIKPKHPNAWTPDEDQILIDNYTIMGDKVYTILPGRTKSACDDRIYKLGISSNPSHWSEDEDQILRDNYPTMGSDVCKLLCGRSKRACTARAHVLRIANSARWSYEEDKILIENYPSMGLNVYKILPGRSRDGCKARARTLKLYSDRYIGMTKNHLKNKED